MVQQVINVGSGLNTGDGEPLRNALVKTNSNFTELYNTTNSLAAVSTIAALQTARVIALSGDIAGSISFDGSSNVTIISTIASSGVTAGTYDSVVVNSKGIVTYATNPTTTITGDVSGSGTTSINVILGASGVTAGTYNSLVVNSKGLVTAGSFTPVIANITVTGDVTGISSNGTIVSTLSASGVTAGTYNSLVVNSKGLVTAGSFTPVIANITVTGDVTGISSNGTIVSTLSASGVTAGTYTQVVVNSKGLITSASQMTNGTTLSLSGALVAASATITGATTINGVTALGGYNESLASPMISLGSLSIDFNQGTVFNVTMTSSITSVSFTNVPSAGRVASAILIFTSTGSAYSINWPASVRWANSLSPVLTATNGKIDLISIFTPNNGSYWIANTIGQNY